MTAKEKAISILDKINGSEIKILEWQKASDYAKSDLKRKANVAVDEILLSGTMVGIPNYGNKSGLEYWQEVKSEIEKL